MSNSFVNIKDKVFEAVQSLFEKVFGKYVSGLFAKPANILFLGIDNSGKTTLVSKLKNNTNHIYLPTKHMVKERIEIGNLTASVFDIGGHTAARIAWKDYFYKVDGIVFIVDVYDEERYAEVREAYETVTSLEQNAPILVLMNKIDLIGEDSHSMAHNHSFMQQIESVVGIDRRRNNTEILYLSILTENTFDEKSLLRGGFAWMSKVMQEKNEHKNY
ncbi:hypothetical protein NUSPORA_02912 [Nucleospora cyclopteri]